MPMPIPVVEIGIAASLLMLGWQVRHPQECPRSHPASQW
jgi:hydrogenase/urease accessory protein HupE